MPTETPTPDPREPAAVALGRRVQRATQVRAGQSRSEAKQAAARANGKKGGRPKNTGNATEPVAE